MSFSFQFLTCSQVSQISGTSTPFYSMNSILNNVNDATDFSKSWTSGFINLHSNRNLYIISPNLGNYKTYSLSGEYGIVKKVPVEVNYGELIFDRVVMSSDYLDCSNQTLSMLEFQLKDLYGNEIDLNGNHWSFSIVFVKIPEE